MDLIGGGAKTPDDFLKYMGDYRPGLGSPFQISIPSTGQDAEHPDQGIVPVKYSPLNCADNGLEARCTCVDCPDVCTSLPYVPPPPHPNDPTCTVGAVSCLTFSCLIIYAVLVLFGLSAYSWKLSLRHRQKRHERVALTDPPQPPLGSPTVKPSGNPFSHHFFSNHGSAGGGNGREELLTEVSSGRRTSGDGGDPRQVGSGSGTEKSIQLPRVVQAGSDSVEELLSWTQSNSFNLVEVRSTSFSGHSFIDSDGSAQRAQL